MNGSWRRTCAGAVAVAVAASGCQDSGPEDDGRIHVVAAFAPLAELAAQVGGDRVRVTELTPPGVEPHDLELSPDDVDDLEDADLVLYLGRDFQPALDDVAGRLDEAVDLLDALPLEEVDGRDDDEDADPHVWLDPTLFARLVEVVADELSERSPDDEAAFRSRADDYEDELARLDAELAAGLADCDRRDLVTAHAAFHYLAERYDLVPRSISGIAPEAEPDPRRLAELADLVEDRGVTTIFTEELVSDRVARALARETGVTTAVLDPIEGLTDDDRDAGRGYVDVMRRNLDALVDGLGCRPR